MPGSYKNTSLRVGLILDGFWSSKTVLCEFDKSFFNNCSYSAFALPISCNDWEKVNEKVARAKLMNNLGKITISPYDFI